VIIGLNELLRLEAKVRHVLENRTQVAQHRLDAMIAGERYSIDPFIPHYSRNRKGEVQFLSAPRKVGVLKQLLGNIDRADIAELLDWYFNPTVRNSFAHADYTLHEDKFRSRSEQFEVDAVLTTQLPLKALVELVNRTLVFFETFVTEYAKQRGSYAANKVITGRIAGDERDRRSSCSPMLGVAFTA
jgi:hypothetical protein